MNCTKCKNNLRYVLLVFLSIAIQISCSGQKSNRYQINTNREIGILAGGGILLGIGLKLKTTIIPYTSHRLDEFNVANVNRFDRIATRHNSLVAKQNSNILGYTSLSLPLFFGVARHSRTDFKQIALVWGEVILANASLTSLSKHIFKRPRPYVYRLDDDTYNKQSRTAQASFVSGHTSMMAANMYFFATTFATYFPSSKIKPIVWTAAIATPALMGYLRVRAGVHYPTDVIAGYALGALVGVGIPAIHKKGKNLVKIHTTNDQVGMVLTF